VTSSEHGACRDAVKALVAPRSVVIVGASGDPANLIASAPLENLQMFGYPGEVYLVNPSRSQVNGIKCYPAISDLPEVPDAAIVTVAAERVPAILTELDAAGVSAATVVTAGVHGFKAPDHVRVLGAESLGVTNLLDQYVPRAARNQRSPASTRAGGIAVLTQSGAMSNVLFNRLQSAGGGVAMSMNTGSELDLTVWDIVAALVEDERITCFAVVIEHIKNPDLLVLAATRALELGKPIVLLELGRSRVGREAVRTHSGSIAGSHAVHQEAYRRLGILTVQELDELWRTALLFSEWGTARVPRAQRRLGIVTLSGGEGALLADRCEALGLELPPLSPAVQAKLEAEYPESGRLNPLDPTTRVLSDQGRVSGLLATVLGGRSFTDLLVSFPVYNEAFAANRLPPALNALAKVDARVLVATWPAPPLTDAEVAMISEAEVPSLGTSLDSLRPIALHMQYGDLVTAGSPKPLAILSRSTSEAAPSAEVTYEEAKTILAGAGFRFAASRRLAVDAHPDEIVRACAELTPPFVVKANSNSTVHKMAAGLVRLDLPDVESVVSTIRSLAAAELERGARLEQVVVEEQLQGHWELYFGARVDPEFGPVVSFGFGGGLAEEIGDTALALLPIERGDARALMSRTRLGRAVVRSSPAAARAVEGQLEALASWLAAPTGDGIDSVDVNPVLLWRDGMMIAVDARVEHARKPGR
jgi:acetate---CoA ligase (ADP-forming)